MEEWWKPERREFFFPVIPVLDTGIHTYSGNCMDAGSPREIGVWISQGGMTLRGCGTQHSALSSP